MGTHTVTLIILLIFLSLPLSSLPALSAEPEHPGVLEKLSTPADNPYAKIDVKESLQAMNVLLGDNQIDKAVQVQHILEHPERFTPPVLYMLAYVLFEKGRRDEAMFWFYAGQLRARYDANRCADESAKAAVQELNRQIGPYINPYAFQDLEKLKKTVAEVMEWDQNTPYLYDQRWINLHGVDATLPALKGQESVPEPAMSLPESQWAGLHRETREQYLTDFKEVLKILAERKAGL